jgi:hypothetical protein
MLLILTEVQGHRAHAGGDVCGVELEMILSDHGAVQAFCFFNRQFFHAFVPPRQILKGLYSNDAGYYITGPAQMKDIWLSRSNFMEKGLKKFFYS